MRGRKRSACGGGIDGVDEMGADPSGGGMMAMLGGPPMGAQSMGSMQCAAVGNSMGGQGGTGMPSQCAAGAPMQPMNGQQGMMMSVGPAGGMTMGAMQPSCMFAHQMAVGQAVPVAAMAPSHSQGMASGAQAMMGGACAGMMANGMMCAGAGGCAGGISYGTMNMYGNGAQQQQLQQAQQHSQAGKTPLVPGKMLFPGNQ